MLENDKIRQLLVDYIQENKIAGAYVIVRKNGKVVCDSGYGYADIEKKVPIKRNSIFRLASLTKPVIAVCVMMLEEDGALSLDDPIDKYLSGYGDFQVADRLIGFEDYYEADPDNPARPKIHGDLLDEVHPVPQIRKITLRDLLTHCSGMGQGPVSMREFEKLFRQGQSLDERIEQIPSVMLDFQPGQMTGYSASVAFEVLGKVIEIVSGKNLQTFVEERILQPLEISDLGFCLTEEQKKRVVRLYEGNSRSMKDVTDTEPFWKLIEPFSNHYYSGSAGMVGSVEAYDRFVSTLTYENFESSKRILLEQSVKKMSHSAAYKRMEFNPGTVWGLGMAVVENPEKAGRKVGKGTYGWSGAYGTHFIIDPSRHITAVLGVNCSNIGGADSVLSRELEEIIFDEF